MKRFLTVLAAMMLLASSACAEIVGRAGDDYIHRWDAPNGQGLYFVSRETEPYVVMKDVNFDGVEDVVVTTFIGASNFGAEFFVWDGGQYVPVGHSWADSLMNYTLYPEAGLVETYVQEGLAGALHTTTLWRWNGTDLEPVRIASGSEVSAMTIDGDLFTVVTDSSRVQLRVRDELNPVEADGAISAAVLLDVTVSIYDEEALSAAMAEERRVLWEGLTP